MSTYYRPVPTLDPGAPPAPDRQACPWLGMLWAEGAAQPPCHPPRQAGGRGGTALRVPSWATSLSKAPADWWLPGADAARRPVVARLALGPEEKEGQRAEAGAAGGGGGSSRR